jgi:hypothetical protein
MSPCACWRGLVLATSCIAVLHLGQPIASFWVVSDTTNLNSGRTFFSQFNLCAELHHLGSGNQEVIWRSDRIARHESVETLLPDRNVRPE